MQRKIACFVFAILLGAALTAAKVTFTPVSATAFLIAPSSGGEVKCLGGIPTGPFPHCTPGSKVQFRGVNETSQVVSADPLFSGIRSFVFNANFDETGRGPMWGTYRLVLDGGRGEWEGTFTGFAHGWFGAAEGHAVGHGTQGEVDGMESRGVFSLDDNFPFGLETITGYRFDPKGNH